MQEERHYKEIKIQVHGIPDFMVKVSSHEDEVVAKEAEKELNEALDKWSKDPVLSKLGLMSRLGMMAYHSTRILIATGEARKHERQLVEDCSRELDNILGIMK